MLVRSIHFTTSIFRMKNETDLRAHFVLAPAHRLQTQPNLGVESASDTIYTVAEVHITRCWLLHKAAILAGRVGLVLSWHDTAEPEPVQGPSVSKIPLNLII